MSHTPDDPLPVRGRDNADRTFTRPTLGELTQRLRRLGSGGDEWIVVDRIPNMPHDVIQAWADKEAGPIQVSYRIGDDPWMEADLSPDAAVEVFAGWARNRSGWEGGHPWARAEWWNPDPVPAPAPEAAAETTVLAARYLAEGYLSFDEMVRALQEMSETDPPITTAQADEILAPMWRERVAAQADWGTTDCDRIAAAFVELDQSGIIAREHFSCCQRCGTAEIWDEADLTARGYVFFHIQDTETAGDGVLYLAYGSRSNQPEDTVAVGHEVVNTLQAQGLRTAWNGSESTRIQITDLEWQKRLE